MERTRPVPPAPGSHEARRLVRRAGPTGRRRRDRQRGQGRGHQYGRRGGRRRVALRRVVVLLGVVVLVAIALLSLRRPASTDTFPPPGQHALAGMSVAQRIVAVAESQVGYRTQPSDSYCNKYSAYWDAGQADCPNGERTEEWCADFAAWAWQEAGVPVTYGYLPGEINGAAASFYQWAVAHGVWHPVGSGYLPAPGDVAVYGLSIGSDPSAAHVAVVTSDAAGQQGPDVVNGDGDRTGFSVVETGTDQFQVHTDHGASDLAGYVSPP